MKNNCLMKINKFFSSNSNLFYILYNIKKNNNNNLRNFWKRCEAARDKIESKFLRLSGAKVKGYQPRARTSCRRKERASKVSVEVDLLPVVSSSPLYRSLPILLFRRAQCSKRASYVRLESR